MIYKKFRSVVSFLPLGIIVIFNIGFILAHIKGRIDYLRIAYGIILNEFFGFHSAALGIVLAVLCGLLIFRKISGPEFARRFFLVCFLFVVALNLSFFPELNRDVQGQELKVFRRLKTPHLEEALSSSEGRNSVAIGKYLQVGSILNGKALIIPWPSGDEGFSSILGFIDPTAVLRKKYSYLIGANHLELLKTLTAQTSRFSIKDRLTDSIIVMSETPDAEEFTLFRLDRTIYFFSPEIVKRLSMDPHD